MVYRVYVEKKEEFATHAQSVFNELKTLLRIDGLTRLRILNRYDVENIDKDLFEVCKNGVFAEPQVDNVYQTLPNDGYTRCFASEYLPGQFDQRADSAEQCVQIISQHERCTVRTAKVYLFYGEISEDELAVCKKYLINPVEAREASLEEKEALLVNYAIPTEVKTVVGFRSLTRQELETFVKSYGLAMDTDDAAFLQAYFKHEEKRDPTITEIRMIDTYWSDHCRHTTFLTTIDKVEFEDKRVEAVFDEYLAVRKKLNRTKPVNLMDIATIAMKAHRQEGLLDKLDESEEINACTVKIKVNVDGEEQDWLLLFKNETHNHPTEIEPFGGAATCIGGAIRDPLSGRAYVYAAMRVTGAGNPLAPLSETIEGKLPQRKLVTTAADGYSSYGNQIGLATGIVEEIYHDGYRAKRMEIGAVIGAAPIENVRREVPKAGDKVILLGGKTGRDGCGGATGSSKSHTKESLITCGAEVQKGNAPEERKLQRLFRNKEAANLIKRCNDFGAGGVSVAIGELADGLVIELDKVTKKYDGLDGTELAISESQERMAVVVEDKDVSRFLELANSENLEATVVATIRKEPRLTMYWNGKAIVDVSRDFLNSNGAEKRVTIKVGKPDSYSKPLPDNFEEGMKALVGDLNVCSKQGLSERFDSTIGANTVLMPFGGKYQRTPIQAMAHKVPLERGNTDTCSVMSWGYNPFITEKDEFTGAYLAVVESVCKLIATGAEFKDVYLTLQEYFERVMKDAEKWGKPLAALLGAFKAQRDLGISAIGGKDSMSGTFENMKVPSTLVSFAVTTTKAENIISPEFKRVGSRVIWLKPQYDERGLPTAESLIKLFSDVADLVKRGKALAIYTPTYGGVGEAVFKMSIGNGYGFDFGNASLEDIFGYSYGSFIIEVKGEDYSQYELGRVTEDNAIRYGDTVLSISELLRIYDSKLSEIYPVDAVGGKATQIVTPKKEALLVQEMAKPQTRIARPRVLIPVFPGTNCEYDTARAWENAGATATIFVINNLTAQGIAKSVEQFAEKLHNSEILFVPGGFSGGDEPDGSGKFITAFLKNAAVKKEIELLLNDRKGLIGGVCNGFQALIKLGLTPYGEIREMTEKQPTLSYNTIARHQSMIVRVRALQASSPWLRKVDLSKIYNVPISHGEGRLIADDDTLRALAENGQIATVYVDMAGEPATDAPFNPNGSAFAIEGLLSCDGRVFGRMGHSERIGHNLYRNVIGEYDMQIFASAVAYFKE